MSYTVLMRDRTHGLLGAASASRSLAVGNSVIAVDPAIGVVASQAWTKRVLRHELLEAMAAGATPAEAIGRLAQWDDKPELRQIAALAPHGTPAAFTGSNTTGWAGELVLDDAVVIGNFLTGADVLDAMASQAGLHTVNGDIYDAAAAMAVRLLDVLRGGEAAGGDARGRQSAAVLVAQAHQPRRCPPEMLVDLRIDDHHDPLSALARLVERRTQCLREDEMADQRSNGVTAPNTTVSSA